MEKLLTMALQKRQDQSLQKTEYLTQNVLNQKKQIESFKKKNL